MQTLPEHREKIIRLMEGGVATDENRLDDHYVDSVINDARANVLRTDFVKFRRWSPAAIQPFYPDYSEDLQDSACYTTFLLPTNFIQANDMQDGLVYFGSSSNKIETTRNFRRIKSRSELSDFVKSQTMNPSRYVGVLIEGLRVTVISKNRIKEPMITGVFDTPAALPTYNIKADAYPISDDLAQVMYTYILQTTMGVVYSKNPDDISSSSTAPQLYQPYKSKK